MPPRYLRKASPTRLKPCAEFMIEACDSAPTDGCCGATVCRLCLEWEVYGEAIAYGSAIFAGSSWTGTVGGVAFVSYWERNSYDECEYIVTLDDEEVYRATCYEGASCRNPAGEVAVSTAYLEGTLRWSKHEPRELALIDNPDTGCRDFFCGSCRCSCECLCVTITDVGIIVGEGEICDVSYPCDAPVWEGTVGYYELSVALGRDEYTGECVITLTANGEEQDPVFVTGCADMSASVTLYDGTIISVACKQCSCEEIGPFECECRADFDATMLGTVVSGGTSCNLSPIGGAIGSGGTLVPLAERAWNPEDCVFAISVTDLIFPLMPSCLNPDNAKYIVIVKKASDATNPFRDDTIVQKYEYYGVVYHSSGSPLRHISYEYSLCCKNETPGNAATSHLIYITIHNMLLGSAYYDFTLRNPTQEATYGGC